MHYHRYRFLDRTRPCNLNLALVACALPTLDERFAADRDLDIPSANALGNARALRCALQSCHQRVHIEFRYARLDHHVRHVGVDFEHRQFAR